MRIQEFPLTLPSDANVALGILRHVTLVPSSDNALQYGPTEYTIAMVPPLACSRMKYNFVLHLLLGECTDM
jgi:hypothetical protein